MLTSTSKPILLSGLIAACAIAAVTFLSDSDRQDEPSPLQTLADEYVKEAGVIKNIHDQRHYKPLTLENGLTVMLISDPGATTSAVALSVGVGSFQNPPEFPGMAHYLEHMIFQSSAKYPQTNALKAYVENHAGMANAFTKDNSTTYLMQLESSALDGALARLGAAMGEPLFDPAFSDKERQAVHAEWEMNRNNPNYDTYRVDALTANPEHPYHNFRIGNLESLQDGEKQTLQQGLWAFYNRYYSANIMTLALTSNLPLAELERQVIAHFSALPNREIERPLVAKAPFLSEQTGMTLDVAVPTEHRLLNLQFPLHLDDASHFSRAADFVVHQLNRQDEHSLLGKLRAQGITQQAGCMTGLSASPGFADLQCFFVLTEQGQQVEPQVVSAFFDFSQQLKQQVLSRDYLSEFAYVKKVARQNYTVKPALELAVEVSENLLNHPLEYAVVANSYFKGLQAVQAEHVFAQLRPENLRLWHIGKGAKGETWIPYAKHHYAKAKLNVAQLSQLDHPWSLQVAKAQVPERASEVNLAASSLENRAPQRLLNQDGVTAWQIPSEAFEESEEGITGLFLAAPETLQSAKNLVMNHLINDIFRDENVFKISKAKMFSGVQIFAHGNLNGHTYMTVGGKSRQHEKHLLELLESFRDLTIEQSELNDKIAGYLKSLSDIEQSPPLHQMMQELNSGYGLQPVFWSIAEKREVLNRLTLAEVQDYHQLLLKSQLQLIALTNQSPAQVKELALKARQLLGQAPQREWHLTQTFTPQTEKPRSLTKSVAANDVVLMQGYIALEQSRAVEANLLVLNQFMQTAFFNALRSEQQLGYVAQTLVVPLHRYPTLALLVQSNHTPLAELHQRINHFLSGYAETLAALSPEQIDESVEALTKTLEQQAADIYQELSPKLVEWMNDERSFNHKEELLQALKQVSKESLLAQYQSLILDKQAEQFSVQIRGENFKETDFALFAEVEEAKTEAL